MSIRLRHAARSLPLVFALVGTAACGAFSSSGASLNDAANGAGSPTGGVGARDPVGSSDELPQQANLPTTGQDDPNTGTDTVGMGTDSTRGGTGTDTGTGSRPPTPAKEPAFAFGAILDFDGLGPHGKQSANDFVQKTGVVPTVIDSYVQLKADGSFELGLSKTLIDQAVGAKVQTVCLSVTSRVEGKLGDAQMTQLVSAVTYGLSKGVNMEVRFAYEMNGDWSPSNSTNGVAYTPTKFLAQWAQIAPKVQAAGGKMFWSPNIPYNTGSALERWLPADTNTIDIVGIDYYPKANPTTAATVAKAIDTIYPIAKRLNKPMLFGESAWQNTGTSIQENASEAKSKAAWLTALTDANLRGTYPLYAGFRWFDYQKYENNTYNNFSISADPYAATAFTAWYKTSVFAGK